jgi:hypothetical protein
MKQLLIVILILAPNTLTTKTTIDLDNKGLLGSEYLKHLEWVEDKNFKDFDTNIAEYKTESTPNTEVKFTHDSPSGINLSTKLPTITVSDALNEDPFLDYNVTLQPSEDCLIYDYPEIKSPSDIQCTYSNGRYTSLVKTATRGQYKKEISLGKYLLGVRETGELEVGVIVGNEVKYHKMMEAAWFHEEFKEILKLRIDDVFIHNTDSDDYLFIFSGDFLIVYTYLNSDSMISLEIKEKINTNPFSSYLTSLKNVAFFSSGDMCLIILKEGIVKLKKSRDSGEWSHVLVEKLEVENTVMEIKDMEIVVESFNICVIIKGYGLVYAILNHFNILYATTVIKHKYLTGFVPSMQGKNFSIGVLVDNQADENVKEFFIELFYSDKEKVFRLSRVFTSSRKVNTVQSDFRGSVNMFLLGEDIYLIPRNTYQMRTLPIYTFKS